MNKPQANPVPEVHCWQCGQKHSAMARICVHCGCEPAPTRYMPSPSGGATGSGKKKGIAVVLALFMSWWTFLYTWKKDGAWFLAGLLSTLFVIGPGQLIGFLMIVANVDTPREELVGVGFIIMAASGFAAFIIWLLSLITTCRRSPQWYAAQN